MTEKTPDRAMRRDGRWREPLYFLAGGACCMAVVAIRIFAGDGLLGCLLAATVILVGGAAALLPVFRRDRRSPRSRVVANAVGVRAPEERRGLDEAALRTLLSEAVLESGDSVVVTDRQGTICWVNPAFEQITGYASEEAIGRTPRILKSGVQDADFYRALWERLTSGSVWRGHFVNRRKDGSTYELEQTITPIRDRSGEIRWFLAVGRDVTTEMQLRSQLLQAQKMEAVGRLAGGVAHDFNNLLTVILTYIGFVREGLREGSQAAEDVREVEHAARSAANLCRKLLLLSRHDSAVPQRIDLARVVTDLVKMLRRVLGDDVRVEAFVENGGCEVEIDPVQVEQVVMNLAVNARDAMPAGGTLTLRTEAIELDAMAALREGVAPGRWVLLLVRDTGAGMPPEVLSRVWEPFYTTKSREKGTGLGLPTVYQIVRKAGGNVRIESEEGRGTTVRILLPPAGERDERSASGDAPAPAELRGSSTVLVVEDSGSVRHSLSRSLSRYGYRVLEAAGAVEALQICAREKGPIDILLTNLKMEGMSGVELARRLRKRLPGLRVILCTGWDDEALRQEGFDPARMELLRKPFSEQDLLRLLHEPRRRLVA